MKKFVVTCSIIVNCVILSSHSEAVLSGPGLSNSLSHRQMTYTGPIPAENNLLQRPLKMSQDSNEPRYAQLLIELMNPQTTEERLKGIGEELKEMMGELPPQELQRLVRDLFNKIDEGTNKFAVEAIKLIGEAINKFPFLRNPDNFNSFMEVYKKNESLKFHVVLGLRIFLQDTDFYTKLSKDEQGLNNFFVFLKKNIKDTALEIIVFQGLLAIAESLGDQIEWFNQMKATANDENLKAVIGALILKVSSTNANFTSYINDLSSKTVEDRRIAAVAIKKALASGVKVDLDSIRRLMSEEFNIAFSKTDSELQVLATETLKLISSLKWAGQVIEEFADEYTELYENIQEKSGEHTEEARKIKDAKIDAGFALGNIIGNSGVSTATKDFITTGSGGDGRGGLVGAYRQGQSPFSQVITEGRLRSARDVVSPRVQGIIDQTLNQTPQLPKAPQMPGTGPKLLQPPQHRGVLPQPGNTPNSPQEGAEPDEGKEGEKGKEREASVEVTEENIPQSSPSKAAELLAKRIMQLLNKSSEITAENAEAMMDYLIRSNRMVDVQTGESLSLSEAETMFRAAPELFNASLLVLSYDFKEYERKSIIETLTKELKATSVVSPTNKMETSVLAAVMLSGREPQLGNVLRTNPTVFGEQVFMGGDEEKVKLVSQVLANLLPQISEVLKGQFFGLIVTNAGMALTSSLGIISFLGFIDGPSFTLAEFLKMFMKFIPEAPPAVKHPLKNLPPIADYAPYLNYIFIILIFLILKKKMEGVDYDLLYETAAKFVKSEKEQALKILIKVKPRVSSQLRSRQTRRQGIRISGYPGIRKPQRRYKEILPRREKMKFDAKELRELEIDVNKRLRKMKYWANYLSSLNQGKRG